MPDNSILAFSAASFRRCMAILSADRSMPLDFLNSATIQSMMRWSKSSPPRWVSPVGGQHFEHALADVEDGNVERAAAEVVDHDLLLGFLIHTVSQRSRGRLVDDAQNLKTRNLARVLGRLALGVGEVRRHGDDRLGHRLTEVGFRVRLELLQDHCGDLLRGIGLCHRC